MKLTVINGISKLPLLYIPQPSHYFWSLSLSSTIMPGILWVRTKNSKQMAQENDTLRKNMSTLIIHYLYGHFLGPQEIKQYLQQNNTYKNDEQSFQCTCILYKYSPITVKYSYYTITHYEVQSISHTELSKSTESLLATWKDCLHPYTNCVY
jgi:hypothetical protein